jgi:AcrR family transcriptional regulator
MLSIGEKAGPALRAAKRKSASRERLLAAARQLFTKRGYHATRPQDIARAADVGHGTFYLHFADKRACFLAFAEAARVEIEGFVHARLAGVEGIEPQLRALLDALMDYAARNPGVVNSAMTDVSVIASDAPQGLGLVDRWATQWAAQIRAGARVGAIRADYDAEIVGHAIVGLLRGAAGFGVRRRARRAQVVDTVATFLVRALVPQNGAAAAQRHNLLAGSQHDSADL